MVKSVHVPRRHDDGGKYDQWMEFWPDMEIAVGFQMGGGPHECVCATINLPNSSPGPRVFHELMPSYFLSFRLS